MLERVQWEALQLRGESVHGQVQIALFGDCPF
jgi:hypothetical protein